MVTFEEAMKMLREHDPNMADTLEDLCGYDKKVADFYKSNPGIILTRIVGGIKTKEEINGAENLARTNFRTCLMENLNSSEESGLYHVAALGVIDEHIKSGNKKKLIKLIGTMRDAYEKEKRIVGPTFELGNLLGQCEALETITLSDFGSERLSDSVKDPKLKKEIIATEELAEKNIRSCLEKSMFEITPPYTVNPSIESKMVKVSSEDSRKRACYHMATLGLIRKYIRTGNMEKLKEIADVMDNVYLESVKKFKDFEEKVNYETTIVDDKEEKIRLAIKNQKSDYEVPMFSLGLIFGMYEILNTFIPQKEETRIGYKEKGK